MGSLRLGLRRQRWSRRRRLHRRRGWREPPVVVRRRRGRGVISSGRTVLWCPRSLRWRGWWRLNRRAREAWSPRLAGSSGASGDDDAGSSVLVVAGRLASVHCLLRPSLRLCVSRLLRFSRSISLLRCFSRSSLSISLLLRLSSAAWARNPRWSRWQGQNTSWRERPCTSWCHWPCPSWCERPCTAWCHWPRTAWCEWPWTTRARHPRRQPPCYARAWEHWPWESARPSPDARRGTPYTWWHRACK